MQKVILCEILFKNVRFYSYFRWFWVAEYTIGDQKLVPCDHKYIFGAPACVLDSKTKFRFFFMWDFIHIPGVNLHMWDFNVEKTVECTPNT